MRSIQQRLGWGLAFVLLVIGIILAQSTLWLFDHSLRRYLEADLRDDSQALLAAIIRTPTGLQLDQTRLNPTFQRPLSGHYFSIHWSDHEWRSRSLWDNALAQPEAQGLQADLLDGPREQQLLVYRMDYQRLGQSFSITVARDYTPILQGYRQMLWWALGLGSAALVLVLLAQRFTVRLALKPLGQVREQVHQLQQGQRARLDTAVPQELSALVGQINHLLLHTEETLKRSRNALGNLGHALKTPLAVLLSLIEREELRQRPQLHASLREPLLQIRQRLERELNRARLAGEVLPGAYFEPRHELPRLCETLQMIHRRGLEIRWHSSLQVSLPYDREDMLELLGNLLDNACKWAKTQVHLNISQAPDGYYLSVEDDGPGIAQDQREVVLARGSRLDEQVQGHGLGLAIVLDMVAVWQGSLSLEHSALGGLAVQVKLPLR